MTIWWTIMCAALPARYPIMQNLFFPVYIIESRRKNDSRIQLIFLFSLPIFRRDFVCNSSALNLSLSWLNGERINLGVHTVLWWVFCCSCRDGSPSRRWKNGLSKLEGISEAIQRSSRKDLGRSWKKKVVCTTLLSCSMAGSDDFTRTIAGTRSHMSIEKHEIVCDNTVPVWFSFSYKTEYEVPHWTAYFWSSVECSKRGIEMKTKNQSESNFQPWQIKSSGARPNFNQERERKKTTVSLRNSRLLLQDFLDDLVVISSTHHFGIKSPQQRW